MLALQGCSVALLPRASCFAFAFTVFFALLPCALCFALAFSVALHLHPARFACARFGLRALEKFRKVSQLTWNALKRKCKKGKKKKEKFGSIEPIRVSRVAQSPSGELQPYLPHVTPRIQSLMPIGSKLDAREIHTNKPSCFNLQFHYTSFVYIQPTLWWRFTYTVQGRMYTYQCIKDQQLIFYLSLCATSKTDFGY